MSARAALFTALAFGLAVPLGAQPSITGTEPLRAKAERGNAIAQYNLGLAYAEGRGAAVDPVEAFAWLSLAADAGGNAKALAQLQDKLTPEQIAAGRQRIAALRTEFAALRTPGPAATASPASLAREEPPAPADGAEHSPEAARRALVAELHAARAESAQLRRDLAARSMTRATSAGDIAALEAQLREAQSSLAAQSVELAAARVDLAKANSTAPTAAPATNAPDNASEKLASLETELRAATRARDDAVAQSRNQLQTLSAERTAWAAEKTHLSTERDELSRRLAQAQADSHSADEARQRVSALGNELASARQQLSAAVAERTRLQNAYSDAELQRRQLAQSNQKYSDSTARISLLESELTESRRQLAAVTSSLDQANSQLRTTATSTGDLTAQASRAADALARAESRASQLAADNETLTRRLAHADAAARQTVPLADLNTARQHLVSAQREVGALREQAAALTARLADTSSSAQDTASRTSRLLTETEEKLASALRTQAVAARERDDLAAQVAAATAALAQAEKRAQAAPSDAEVAELRQQLAAAQKELSSLRGELTTAKETTERATRALAEHEDKLNAALRSYTLATKERDELSARVASLTTKANAATEALAQANTAAGSDLVNARKELAKLSQDLTAAREQAASATTAREEAELKLTTSLRSYSLVAKERDDLAASVAALSAQAASSSQALAQAKAQMASTPPPAASPELEPLRASLAEAQRQLASATQEIAALREQVATARSVPSPSSTPTPVSAPTVASVAPSTTPQRPAQPPALESTFAPTISRTHTVAKGETLSGIAHHYYGNASRWREIYDANRDALRNDQHLVVGRVLRIP